MLKTFPVRRIAEAYGTPLYIYSYSTLLRHFKAYDDAFDGVPHIICFALKANSNTAVLEIAVRKAAEAPMWCREEKLFRALKAAVSSRKIVYAGVGKTEDEIRYALKSKILMFNVESESELMEIDRIAGIMKVKAPISLRVNPDIDPGDASLYLHRSQGTQIRHPHRGGLRVLQNRRTAEEHGDHGYS